MRFFKIFTLRNKSCNTSDNKWGPPGGDKRVLISQNLNVSCEANNLRESLTCEDLVLHVTFTALKEKLEIYGVVREELRKSI